jgi:hypothetical protein
VDTSSFSNREDQLEAKSALTWGPGQRRPRLDHHARGVTDQSLLRSVYDLVKFSSATNSWLGNRASFLPVRFMAQPVSRIRTSFRRVLQCVDQNSGIIGKRPSSFVEHVLNREALAVVRQVGLGVRFQ